MVDPPLPGRRAGSRAARRWVAAAWGAAAVALLGLCALGVRLLWGFGTPVSVTVDGYRAEVRTTRADVAGLLADLGLALRPADRVDPALDTPLAPGLAVTVRRARPGLVSCDGALYEVYSQATTVAGLLAGAGVHASVYDEVSLDGDPVALDDALPPAAAPDRPPRFAPRRPWDGRDPEPVRLSMRRAVPITVDDGSVPYTIYTTAATIGEALLAEQLTLYLGDRVQPGLGARVQAGLRVLIERSQAVQITADGRTFQTRTRGKRVGDALTELGVNVAGSDRVAPALSDEVHDNLPIQVVRVREIVQVDREEIPFAAVLEPDDNLDIDRQQLSVVGQPGEYRRRSRLLYEDGELKSQTLMDEWVAAQPITQVVSYGRKITPRALDTPEGTVTYWRKIRMYATSYSAATAGVSPTASYYGITRSGLRMRRGLVAVDPTVIPLGTRIYVAGYGIGLAADTGGGVRAKMVDLGYDDDNLQPWHQWVDVYVLDSPPSYASIRWVLPNWPQYRDR